ncbi:hypothetical protein ACLMAB_05520 [Brevibacillus laterosporus]
MITLDVKKNLENNVYSIEIAVKEIPETDEELFKDFGDIEINTGGTIKITTFEDGKSVESEVTLLKVSVDFLPNSLSLINFQK